MWCCLDLCCLCSFRLSCLSARLRLRVMAFLENTLFAQDLAVSFYLGSSFTIIQHFQRWNSSTCATRRGTLLSLFIISFLISSVAFGEDRIFCNSSKFSLGILSSLIVPLSGLILSTLHKFDNRFLIFKYSDVNNYCIWTITNSINNSSMY